MSIEVIVGNTEKPTVQIPVAKFENTELSLNVNIYEVDGEPMFDAHEVAKALGYERPDKAVKAAHERAKKNGATKSNFAIIEIEGSRSDRPKKLKVCSEAFVYDLTLSSKLASAQKFRYWVCDEVLPSIRKTGGYIGRHLEPEKYDKLINDVKMWKGRALKKRKEATCLGDRIQVLETEKIKWKDRANSAKTSYTLTKVDLEDTLEGIIKSLDKKSSNSSVVRRAKNQIRGILLDAKDTIKVEQYKEYCKQAFDIVESTFDSIEKNRRRGWRSYYNVCDKVIPSNYRIQSKIEMLIDILNEDMIQDNKKIVLKAFNDILKEVSDLPVNENEDHYEEE